MTHPATDSSGADASGRVRQALKLRAVGLLLGELGRHVLGRARAVPRARAWVVAAVVAVWPARVEYLHFLDQHRRHV